MNKNKIVSSEISLDEKIPSINQFKRLEKLQGVDSGVFTLSIFSLIEAYLRSKLKDKINSETSFYELINLYKINFTKNNPAEYNLFINLLRVKKNTNDVRHQFKNLDKEEANVAVHLLNKFANIFDIPNKQEISKLMFEVKIWDDRKTPIETARELEKANLELQKLFKANKDLSEKIILFEEKQNELSLVSSKLKTLELEFENQIEKNKNNKEKIDSLRYEKFETETKYKNQQKEIGKQLKKLEDAQKYIFNLNRMTNYTRTRYDYEQSLVRLTKEQESIVNTVKFTNDFLIKGSAGTGKSLVLLKTLEKLIKQNQNSLFDEKYSIKLLTFTKSLEKYNKYIASLLNIKNPLEEELILTSESYVLKIIKNAFPEYSFSFDNIKESAKKFKDEDFVKENPLKKDLWSEIEKFILPNCVTKTEYCDKKIARTGMKKAQGSENRKKIWSAVEKIFAKWESEKLFDIKFASYKLVQKIKSGEYKIPDELKTDYLFIDEAQDLSAATLQILKAATRKNIILAGDNDQSIFQPGFTWKRAGLDISGYTRILNTNFRSTNQINSVAEKYRATIKGADRENRPETFRLGPPVELHELSSQKNAFLEILQTVKICKNYLNYENENICIIMQQKRQLEEMQKLLKTQLDLDSDFINSSDFDFSKQGIIRLSTTQSCKGLDFPVVLFYLDHRAHFLDDFDEQTVDKINRNIIYTALTRSIELLHVFMLNDCTAKPLVDLKTILKA